MSTALRVEVIAFRSRLIPPPLSAHLRPHSSGTTAEQRSIAAAEIRAHVREQAGPVLCFLARLAHDRQLLQAFGGHQQGRLAAAAIECFGAWAGLPGVLHDASPLLQADAGALVVLSLTHLGRPASPVSAFLGGR